MTTTKVAKGAKELAATLKKAVAAAQDELNKRVDPLDRALEQMAQEYVYKDKITDEQRAFLEAQGFSVGSRITGSSALVMRVFPSNRSGQPSVVAFRGTVFSDARSVLCDLDPVQVGGSAFNENRALIEKTLKKWGESGPLIVTGHSLGGALAQLAACKLPSLVLRVVTFHAPGIDRSEVRAVGRYNLDNPARAIDSRHYVMTDDMVTEAGEAFTDGIIREYKLAGGDKDPKKTHSTFMLADEAAIVGIVVPVRDEGRGVVWVGDRASTTKKSTSIEALRTVVCTVIAAPVDALDDLESAGKKAVKGLKNAADDLFGR